MLLTYLKISLRNILKRRVFSLISISGLALGLASFLVIYLYISNETGYEKFHNRHKDIYRVVNVYNFEGVGENSASSPFPLAFTMLGEYPACIENAVRIYNFQAPSIFTQHGELSFNEKRFFFADSTYFQIFDHEFIRGNPNTALQEQFSVVMTESAAGKYFGNDDPMGKTIRVEEAINLTVTGVIKDVPSQTHIRFDLIASLSSVKSFYRGRLPLTWVWNPCWTYLLLSPFVDPSQLEEQFPEFISKYFYDAEKDNISLYLQPLKDIHLKSKLDYEIEPNNSISSIYILSSIAVFLLLISIINFVNMATATAAVRAREIGIKKVTGARRSELILQFLGESLVISMISTLLSLIILELSAPAINRLIGSDISITQLARPANILLITGLWLITGLLSGLYPALFLSSFKPISVLSGFASVGMRSGLPRKILVAAQFSISIFLIIGTYSIHRQLKYLRSANLGFNSENVMIIPINNSSVAQVYPAFRKELLRHHGILSITAMDDIFGVGHNTHEFRPEGLPEDQWQFYPALVVMYDFLKTFEMEIVAGRDYIRENKSDPLYGILINESMVAHLGWGSPENALGKKMRSLSGDERVIGVIRDFQPTSLREAPGPFVLNMKETPGEVMWFLKYMAVKIQKGTEKSALNFIENKWNDFTPGRPFEYFFLDEKISALYRDEESLSRLSLIFTIIVIFLSMMGLLGLISFMSEQKTKEIGIRRVLGASRLHIMYNLSREFLWLILIASVFAWCLAYLVVDNWLSHFAYRVSLGWQVFFIASAAALVLSSLVTGIRAWLASGADPASTLKYE
ncbi:MAG: ABC transporter permease [Bacteroidales bacterium]|nr:ABC transporter permease [Bacteroidales bacterium]